MTPFLAITALSLALSAAITAIYRVLVKPGEMKKQKEDMKFYKDKMNQAKKAGDTAQMNEYATEMLKASQAQFRLNMKPMMATMLLFFLLLGWLNTSFGGVMADFSKGNHPTFAYGGGNHSLAYSNGSGGFTVGVDLNDDGSFSDEETFGNGDVFEYGGAYWRPVAAMEGFIIFQQPKDGVVHFEMLVAKAPFTIPFVGDYLSWFWWYLFLSIPSTIAFRKLAGVE